MSKVMSLEYGISGVCVLLTLMIFLKVGEFLWALQKKKESLSESTTRDLISAVQANTVATQHLDQRLKHLEKAISDVPKLKTDMRRFYIALKEVAGPVQWPRIRDEFMKDDFAP